MVMSYLDQRQRLSVGSRVSAWLSCLETQAIIVSFSIIVLVSLHGKVAVEANQPSPPLLAEVSIEADGYINKGDNRYQDGLHEEAMALYDKALKLLEGLSALSNRDALLAAQAYRKVGDILAGQLKSNHWIRARDHYERALFIADMYGSQYGVYKAANGLCDVSFRLGNLEEAAVFCQLKHNLGRIIDVP